MNPFSKTILVALFTAHAFSVESWGVEINVTPAAKPKMGKGVMREAPTKEEVLARKAKAPNPYHSASVKPLAEGDDIKAAEQPSLLSSSLLLTDGKSWTILPQRSVLRFADEVKPHIRPGKEGTLVTWEQFQNANKAWIRSIPMNDGHLTGKTAITDEARKQWAESKQLLIGTYSGNPVALPVPPPAPAVQTSQTDTSNPAKP